MDRPNEAARKWVIEELGQRRAEMIRRAAGHESLARDQGELSSRNHASIAEHYRERARLLEHARQSIEVLDAV